MRELWSRRLTVLTGMLVLLLSYKVASVRNPIENSAPLAPGTQEPQERRTLKSASEHSGSQAELLIDAGRRIYLREACARCHSIGGEGNSSSPLDGAGERLTAEEVRMRIIAAPGTENELPKWAFLSKQKYGRLQEPDIEALVAFIQSL